MWLVLFAAYAAGVGLHATPGEDLSAPEAHVLLLTRSIVDEGDLDLSDEYGAAAWRPFYGGTLVPLTGPRERGQLEPIAAGFPLLIAPAYALGGRACCWRRCRGSACASWRRRSSSWSGSSAGRDAASADWPGSSASRSRSS